MFSHLPHVLLTYMEMNLESYLVMVNHFFVLAKQYAELTNPLTPSTDIANGEIRLK